MKIKEYIKLLQNNNVPFEKQEEALVEIEKAIKEAKQKKEELANKNADLIVSAFKTIEDKLNKKFEELLNTPAMKGVKGDKGDKGDTGPAGKDGRDGRDGKDGKDGRDGVDGKDGVGVVDAYIDFDGSLVIKLSDGNEIDAGRVVAESVAKEFNAFMTRGEIIPNQDGQTGKYLKTVNGQLEWSQLGTIATQDLGTIATQDANNVAITGGTISNVSIENATFSTQVASFAWKTNQSAPGGVFIPMPIYLTKAHTGMRRCLLLDNGTVNYYLDPTDSTKKADGTAANLSGADGQVMVEIPKFWTRRVVEGTITTWYVSDTARTGFTVHPAFIKNGVEVNFRYYSAYDACLQFSRSITGVADAGGGNITITTSVQHPLYAGDVVTISGTTNYNGTYTVVSRASTTTFTVTATFVSTQTGTAAGYVSGKNLDNMTANINTATDKLASISGWYPLVGVTRATCRTLSNRGTGWRQLDFTLWSAIQMLYLTEFQSFFSQNILGAGNTAGSYLASSTAQTDSPHTLAGASNFMGSMSTNTVTGANVNLRPGTSFMSYRGIENLYGNCWNWADGINVNVTTNGNVFVTNNQADFADNISTNMTLISTTAPTTSGFVSAIAAIDDYFIPSSVSGGSTTTFLTDQWFGSTSSNRVVLVGGGADRGALAGAFGVNASGASSLSDRAVGGRLAF